MEVVNHIITEEEWERIEKDAHARLEAAQKEALEKEKENIKKKWAPTFVGAF